MEMDGEVVKYGWERHPRGCSTLVKCSFDMLGNINLCTTLASRAARTRRPKGSAMIEGAPTVFGPLHTACEVGPLKTVEPPFHIWRIMLSVRAFQEVEMARTPSLTSMSVEALLKLRDEVGKVLSQKAVHLEQQLSKLGGEVGGGRRSGLKGTKVPIKYRDKQGNTWAGRGAQPVWLREQLKAGAKLEDFAVQKTAVARKASPRKAKKRRRKK